MRIGEVCALQWKNVSLQRHTIYVCQTLSRLYNFETKSTELVVSTPKTKSSNREIPISHDLYSALREIKGSSSQQDFVVGNSAHPSEPRTYREYFAKLLRRLRIPQIVFHGLRHTFATRCIECACDYKTVSVILGHSNVATTMNIYVHPNQDQKQRCINRLTKYLN